MIVWCFRWIYLFVVVVFEFEGFVWDKGVVIYVYRLDIDWIFVEMVE